jgi:hypothetical protein
MVKKTISDLIIELHKLAREQADFKTNLAIQKIADDLARVGNEQLEDILAGADHMSDKGYALSTLEKQQEFALKRNYHISNTDNPIDFPDENTGNSR